ncbi:MAG: nicotinamide-nucleotide amidohydrolase family protein [Caldimonas sp.]
MTAAPTQVDQLADALSGRGQTLAIAESCTGGLVAAACTALPGSSGWFERGFVTYSNAAKIELLGVDGDLITAHGAVSEEVARAMAEGAVQRSPAHWSVAVTGIAGPGGGTAAKPVGTVWLAVAERGGPTCSTLLQASGDRTAIRNASAARAIGLLLEALAR